MATVEADVPTNDSPAKRRRRFYYLTLQEEIEMEVGLGTSFFLVGGVGEVRVWLKLGGCTTGVVA